MRLSATQLQKAVHAWEIGGSASLGRVRAEIRCDYGDLLDAVKQALTDRGLPDGLAAESGPASSPEAPQARKGEYAVPEAAKIARCRYCNAEIVWHRTERGKPMPLSVASIERRDGELYALSHFSDCKTYNSAMPERSKP